MRTMVPGVWIGFVDRERQAMGGRWSKEVERNEYGAGGHCMRLALHRRLIRSLRHPPHTASSIVAVLIWQTMTSNPPVPTTIHHLPPLPPHAQINSMITIAVPPHLHIRHSARILHPNCQEDRVGNAACGGGGANPGFFFQVFIAHVFHCASHMSPPPLFPKTRRRRLQSHERSVIGVGLMRDGFRHTTVLTREIAMGVLLPPRRRRTHSQATQLYGRRACGRALT
ncbi:hypothetical protein BJ912DRAFT_32579 [Pholiota molesta]|nr:hypothetical protein BJ912DRAFT_32579 [Pholiota molesta]